MADNQARNTDPNPDPPSQPDRRMGAGDNNSGGGNASGSPSGEIAERVGDVALRGDVEQDKKALFPERFGEPEPRDKRQTPERGDDA